MEPKAGQHEEMKALPALLHSMAHDLAQPLTSARCFLELVTQRKAGSPASAAELADAAVQIDRAIALAKGISALTHEGSNSSQARWAPLDDLLNQIFESFSVLVHTGFLSFERLETAGVLITSNPALRHFLVVVIAKVAGQSVAPIKITVAAGILTERCQLDLSWRPSDSSGLETLTAQAIFARDQHLLQELLREAGADLVECGKIAAIEISAPAVSANPPRLP